MVLQHIVAGHKLQAGHLAPFSRFLTSNYLWFGEFIFLVALLGIDIRTEELPGRVLLSDDALNSVESLSDFQTILKDYAELAQYKLISTGAADAFLDAQDREGGKQTKNPRKRFESRGWDELTTPVERRNVYRMKRAFDQLSNNSCFLPVDLSDEAILLLTDNRMSRSLVVACLKHLHIDTIAPSNVANLNKALIHLGISSHDPVTVVDSSPSTAKGITALHDTQLQSGTAGTDQEISGLLSTKIADSITAEMDRDGQRNKGAFNGPEQRHNKRDTGSRRPSDEGFDDTSEKKSSDADGTGAGRHPKNRDTVFLSEPGETKDECLYVASPDGSHASIEANGGLKLSGIDRAELQCWEASGTLESVFDWTHFASTDKKWPLLLQRAFEDLSLASPGFLGKSQLIEFVKKIEETFGCDEDQAQIAQSVAPPPPNSNGESPVAGRTSSSGLAAPPSKTVSPRTSGGRRSSVTGNGILIAQEVVSYDVFHRIAFSIGVSFSAHHSKLLWSLINSECQAVIPYALRQTLAAFSRPLVGSGRANNYVSADQPLSARGGSEPPRHLFCRITIDNLPFLVCEVLPRSLVAESLARVILQPADKNGRILTLASLFRKAAADTGFAGPLLTVPTPSNSRPSTPKADPPRKESIGANANSSPGGTVDRFKTDKPAITKLRGGRVSNLTDELDDRLPWASQFIKTGKIPMSLIYHYEGYLTFNLYRRFAQIVGVDVFNFGIRRLWQDTFKDPFKITSYLPAMLYVDDGYASRSSSKRSAPSPASQSLTSNVDFKSQGAPATTAARPSRPSFAGDTAFKTDPNSITARDAAFRAQQTLSVDNQSSVAKDATGETLLTGPKYFRIGMDPLGLDPTLGKFVLISRVRRKLPRQLAGGLWPDAARCLFRLSLQMTSFDDEALMKVLTKYQRDRTIIDPYALLRPESIPTVLANLKFEGMSFQMLRTMIYQMKLGIPDRDVKRMFDLMDSNQDQSLDLFELLSGFEILISKFMPEFLLAEVGLSMHSFILKMVLTVGGMIIFFLFTALSFSSFVAVSNGASTAVQSIFALLGAVGLQSGASKDASEVEERMRGRLEIIIGGTHAANTPGGRFLSDKMKENEEIVESISRQLQYEAIQRTRRLEMRPRMLRYLVPNIFFPSPGETRPCLRLRVGDVVRLEPVVTLACGLKVVSPATSVSGGAVYFQETDQFTGEGYCNPENRKGVSRISSSEAKIKWTIVPPLPPSTGLIFDNGTGVIAGTVLHQSNGPAGGVTAGYSVSHFPGRDRNVTAMGRNVRGTLSRRHMHTIRARNNGGVVNTRITYQIIS